MESGRVWSEWCDAGKPADVEAFIRAARQFSLSSVGWERKGGGVMVEDCVVQSLAETVVLAPELVLARMMLADRLEELGQEQEAAWVRGCDPSAAHEDGRTLVANCESVTYLEEVSVSRWGASVLELMEPAHLHGTFGLPELEGADESASLLASVAWDLCRRCWEAGFAVGVIEEREVMEDEGRQHAQEEPFRDPVSGELYYE